MGIKKPRNVAADSLQVPDGLAEIKNELPLIIKMIARTARWVHSRLSSRPIASLIGFINQS
jgi:hypothetical protein